MRAAPAALAVVLLTVSCTSGGSSKPPPSSSNTSDPSSSSGASTAPGSPSSPSSPSKPSKPAPADWPTYQRTGVAAGLPTVHSALRQIWSVRLDGAAYASPVVVNGAKIVVTENDTVYRIENNEVVWKNH